MTIILKADPIVHLEEQNLKETCTQLFKKNILPQLKVILIGDNPASLIYTKNKKKFCEKIGAKCDIIHLPKDTEKKLFLETILRLANDPKVHGLFVQLPLPEQLKDLEFNSLIPPGKDVDGFNPLNLSALIENKSSKKFLTPCTPSGIIKLFNYYKIPLAGKNVLIIGRSLIVGKPLALMLNNLNATVTMAHSQTKNLKDITKNAEIIISALGKPYFLDQTYFKKDQSQIVIDVGINKMDGKTVGDVHFEEVKDYVFAITPVPGGVGPLTVTCLLENLVKAANNFN